MKSYLLATFVVLSLTFAAVLTFIDSLSPLNHRRPGLIQTKYIILHTTEGASASSLNKLKRYGEAHFMVDLNGSIHKLIDEDRIARHSGRSLWDGRPRIDEVSIGIEVVGSYKTPLRKAQESALLSLLTYLKGKYRIVDENILTHSMVAYGAPNRWHHYAHRGRKRCGAQFADVALRARLGIRKKPSRDKEVESGRLIVADKWLYDVLFSKNGNYTNEVQAQAKDLNSNVVSKERSAWFIAREAFDSPTTIYTFPSGRKLRGNHIKNWGELPLGTKITVQTQESLPTSQTRVDGAESEATVFKEIGVHGSTAFQIARSEYAMGTTLYFLPDGRVVSGLQLYHYDTRLLNHLPVGTKVVVGYINGGAVSRDRSAFSITGPRWNSPATFYRLPNGQIVSGDDVDADRIPEGTFIFFEA